MDIIKCEYSLNLPESGPVQWAQKDLETREIFHVLQIQGHPMDLFLKISVLQAHFCWLGDVKEIIVLGRKVLLGKR